MGRSGYKNLLYKKKYDIWTKFLLKKKLNYRLTKFLLHKFSFELRYYLLKAQRKMNYTYKIRKKRRRTPLRFLRRRLHLKGVRPIWKRSLFEKKNNFFKNLNRYFKIKRLVRQDSSILLYWQMSALLYKKKRLGRKIFQKNKTFYYSLGRRLPRFKKTRLKKHLGVVSQAYPLHFCFKDLNKLITYRNYISKLNFKDPNFFGLESVLLNQIFRVNLFPTTRYCYLFIKLGHVYLNGRVCRNPHQLVKVGDTFKINNKLLKRLTAFLWLHLKKKRVAINAPNYIDCNYKVFSFHIWRRPTRQEAMVTETFPFRDINLGLVPPTSSLKKWPKLRRVWKSPR